MSQNFQNFLTLYEGGQRAAALAALTGGVNGVFKPAVFGAVTPFQSQFLIGIPAQYSRGLESGLSNGTTDKGGTSRLMLQTVAAGHNPRAVFANYADLAGESQSPNPIQISSFLELPSGAFIQRSISGKKNAIVWPNGFVIEDPIGISLPANTPYFRRTIVRIALAPLSLAAVGATTGGTIAAGTNVYVVTANCLDGIESGPTASQSVTNTGTTSANTLTIGAPDPLSISVLSYNVYKNGFLYAVLPVGTTTFVDTGALTVGTQPAPTLTHKYPLGPYANFNGPGTTHTGEGSNYASAGGNGSDQSLTAGTSWITGSPSYVFGPVADLWIPDMGFDVPVIFNFGDSIGLGIPGGNGDVGWFLSAFWGVSSPVAAFQLSRGGEYLASTYSNASGALRDYNRLVFAEAASVAHENYATNDINIFAANGTLAPLQTEKLALWQELQKRCPVVFTDTILPRTTSTDSFATTANQFKQGAPIITATNATPIVVSTSVGMQYVAGDPIKIAGGTGNTAVNGSWFASPQGSSSVSLYADQALTIPSVGNGTYNAQTAQIDRVRAELTRTQLNDWLLAGAPATLSGTIWTAVAAGTAGAITCPVYSAAGQMVLSGSGAASGHPLARGGILNPADTIEVNAAGVLTHGGGYWPTNGSTADGTHPSYTIYPTMIACIPMSVISAAP